MFLIFVILIEIQFTGVKVKKVEAHLLKAIDLNHNKFVQACAGAGKTFALSKRYCAILDDFAEKRKSLSLAMQQGPENILVITFTNQAAAEMAERIFKDLNLLLNGEEIEPFKGTDITFGQNIRRANEEYKIRLRSTFSQNSISTIDSFCAKILRANAHKIGLDPKFKLGDDIISQRNFEDTLNDFLQKKSIQFDKNLEILLLNSSLANIKSFLTYIYYHRAYLTPWLEKWEKLIVENKDEQIKREWIKNYTPEFNIKPVLSGLDEIIRFQEDEVKTKEDKGYLFLFELKHLLKQFPQSESEIEQRRFLLLKPLQLFLTGKSEYRKKIPGAKTKWTVPSRFEELQEYGKSFLELLQAVCPEEYYKSPFYFI